jgi:hypothetical protein
MEVSWVVSHAPSGVPEFSDSKVPLYYYLRKQPIDRNVTEIKFGNSSDLFRCRTD